MNSMTKFKIILLDATYILYACSIISRYTCTVFIVYCNYFDYYYDYYYYCFKTVLNIFVCIVFFTHGKHFIISIIYILQLYCIYNVRCSILSVCIFILILFSCIRNKSKMCNLRFLLNQCLSYGYRVGVDLQEHSSRA